MKFHGLLFLIIVVAVSGCRPEIDVLAPEKESYAIWGVLNPTKDEQFIKISKVFQTDQDAYIYANANDLSADGLQVSIRGEGKTWPSELVTVDRDTDGIFSPQHQLYRIATTDTNRLKGGVRYELLVKKPDNDTFLISAYTDIPTQPNVFNPAPPVFLPNLDVYKVPKVNFGKDYTVFFNRSNGVGFEVRVIVEYFEDGVPQTFRYGPTRIFRSSVGCASNERRGEFCFEIPEKSISRTLASQTGLATGTLFINDTTPIATDPNDLSRCAYIEVTAVDTFLTTHMFVNESFGFGLNLLMDKPEISNISGDNVGVFGSINSSLNYILLDACTKYRVGLLEDPPTGCN